MFQKLPFKNFDALIEKPRIKHLRNIDLLHELPFYDELNIEKISKAFKRYARNYKNDKMNLKDPSAQLKASKSSMKGFFKDLLGEIQGFK